MPVDGGCLSRLRLLQESVRFLEPSGPTSFCGLTCQFRSCCILRVKRGDTLLHLQIAGGDFSHLARNLIQAQVRLPRQNTQEAKDRLARYVCEIKLPRKLRCFLLRCLAARFGLVPHLGKQLQCFGIFLTNRD